MSLAESTQLIIGSRDSQLAMVQSRYIRDLLKEHDSKLEISITEIKTIGDKILDSSLSKIGDKGLFTKELELALLEGSIDLAVHSLKDLPTTLPEGLVLAAVSIREDARDVVCFNSRSRDIGSLDQLVKLNPRARIASSSLRRLAQLRKYYPSFEYIDIRGNLNTRFRKLDDVANNIDAIILAAAGLHRLTKQDPSFDRIDEYLDPERFLPAVGQGALGIEILATNPKRSIIQLIDSPTDHQILKGERSFLRALEGGCQVPIGIYSQQKDNNIIYSGMISSLDASQYLKATVEGALQDAELLGKELAQMLIKDGGRIILDNIRL